MIKQKLLINSAEEMAVFGKKIAKEILSLKKPKKAIVLCLEGGLGGGKTTFTQGFAKGLGIKEKVLSPTFVIMRNFKISNFKFRNFYHLDCYRIKNPKEILELGFKEIVSSPKNIVIIEWADKIKKIIPKNAVWIKFKFMSENQRYLMLYK